MGFSTNSFLGMKKTDPFYPFLDEELDSGYKAGHELPTLSGAASKALWAEG